MDIVKAADSAAFSHNALLADGLIGKSGYRIPDERRRGRAAALNPSGRFEKQARESFDDGWQNFEELPPFKTEVTQEKPRSIITKNDSPDLSFDRSVNPYRGCEHGCIYCFARPSHAYMGLSAGLDFESKLFAKPNAAELLRKTLAKPGYKPATIAIGTNTDPYQPIERTYRITHSILALMVETSHPIVITTKSARVVDDIDYLRQLAEKQLTGVAISVTSLDAKLARILEPRASSPMTRLAAVRKLADAGIYTHVNIAPVIPAITDMEIEAIAAAAAEFGASSISWIPIRLPHEVAPLFRDWLDVHFPDRASKVMNHIQEMRGGKDNDPEFFTRMKGHGAWAELMRTRMKIAVRKHKLDQSKWNVRNDLFVPPNLDGQMSLF